MPSFYFRDSRIANRFGGFGGKESRSSLISRVSAFAEGVNCRAKTFLFVPGLTSLTISRRLEESPQRSVDCIRRVTLEYVAELRRSVRFLFAHNDANILWPFCG